MKNLNPIFVATAVALTLNVARAADMPGRSALQNSPRYVELHPEVLLAQASGQAFKPEVAPGPAKNSALAAAPRFREAHPEVIWTVSSAGRSWARNAGESETRNKALAGSPRFLELHPGLRNATPAIEIAPLK
ncbi:MAG TPA: hypothetical protein VHH73_05605 [Verrucomicrobiae bacterium]|nr:hypothetical protein [Verrucomicrobiae bacterium]